MTVVLVVGRVAYIGLSSDTKPVVRAGATFYETDTGAKYVSDGYANWWRNPPLYGYATIPLPLGDRIMDLPQARRSRDYTHLQHAQGTT